MILVSGRVPQHRSYIQTVLSRFAELGNTEAFRSSRGPLSFRQARELVLRLASALHEQRVRPGDGVAVLAGNRPETTLLQFALHLLGARAVWLSTGVAAREQADFLRRASVSVFVYDSDHFAERAYLLADEVDLPRVLSLGESPHPDLLALARRSSSLPASAVAGAGDVCTVFYTGGTTGQPKLVRHGHTFYDLARRIAAVTPVTADRSHRYLACLPIGHSSGQLSVLLALLRGATVVPMNGFDAGTVLRAIERHRITGTFLVPPLLYELLDHPALATTDISSLRCLTYGGSWTAPERLREAVRVLGPVLQQVYGMVEAGVVAALGTTEHDLGAPERLRSCGRPLSMAQVRIRDHDGRDVPASEMGEICVRGPLVMKDYWLQPELTTQTVRDGWLYTGDIGHLDSDGYLYITDRAKDVIITGRNATNVYSRLVEDVLLEHPGVRQVAVVGHADDHLGEVVRACVVAAPAGRSGSELAVELRTLVRRRLGELYEPARVEVVDRLPRTSMGKIDKRALRIML